MWTKARGAGYLIALAIGMGMVAMNLGTFDPDTGMVDPHPFNLYLAVGAIAAFVGAPLTALVAVIRGWGRK
jgi:hypothetical protein